MTKVNEKYYGVLIDYVFGSSDPGISDIASGGAYRDMASHTLVSTRDTNELSAKEKKVIKKEWKRCIIETIITPRVEDLISNRVVDFDTWHHETCDEIESVSCKMLKCVGIVFHYGQAQKWLNMTLKNMLVLEKWKFEDSIVNSLHCPVDSYIITAAKDLGIEVPKKEDGKDKPWSQWVKGDYIGFQKKMVNKLQESPIDWEIRVWPIYKKGLKQSERLKEVAYK